MIPHIISRKLAYNHDLNSTLNSFLLNIFNNLSTGSDYRTSSSRPSGLRVGLTGRTPSNGGFKRLSQDKLALWDNVPSKSKTHHDSDSDMSDIDHFLTKGEI